MMEPAPHRKSTAQHRAASLERRAAAAFGTRRVHRGRYESAPDVEVVRLASGIELVVECKHRAKLPALLRSALAQARSYAPDAIPIVTLAEYGGQAIVALPLADFRRLVGLAPSKVPTQRSLLARAL